MKIPLIHLIDVAVEAYKDGGAVMQKCTPEEKSAVINMLTDRLGRVTVDELHRYMQITERKEDEIQTKFLED